MNLCRRQFELLTVASKQVPVVFRLSVRSDSGCGTVPSKFGRDVNFRLRVI
jgi:hypothetical protein